MQTFVNTFDKDHFFLSHGHFLLDIETTGLSKTNDAIVCIGVMYQKKTGQCESIRWLSELAGQEKDVLQAFLEFCTGYEKAYTYTGKAFDVPFLLSRLSTYELSHDLFKKLFIIDMKKCLSKAGSNRSALETLLGYQRTTTVTGKELAKIGKLFETTSQPNYQVLILAHNSDELHSLAAMYEAYFTLHQLSTYKVISQIANPPYSVLQLQYPLTFHTNFSMRLEDTHISWTMGTCEITLKVLVHGGTFKKYLLPAKDYYWIAGQNELVHKSIAQFIPKNLKQKVSAKQCFVTKNSHFLRVYTPSANAPLWYNDLEERFVEYFSDEKLVPFILQQLAYLLLH
jgi:predicted PolB exonuclease-like 3'-5' exonuclease